MVESLAMTFQSITQRHYPRIYTAADAAVTAGHPSSTIFALQHMLLS
jgi:hypothetical protein